MLGLWGVTVIYCEGGVELNEVSDRSFIMFEKTYRPWRSGYPQAKGAFSLQSINVRAVVSPEEGPTLPVSGIDHGLHKVQGC